MSILQNQFDRKLPRPGKTGLDWYIYDKIVRRYKDQPMMEIGVGYGGSLLTLLNHSKQVWAVDCWYGYEPVYYDYVKYIEKDTKDLSADDLPDVVLCHIDGDKRLTHYDLSLVSDVTSDVIIVDDYFSRKWPEVTWQVTEFLRDNKIWKMNMIGDHQIILTKKDIDFELNIPREGVLPEDSEPFIKYGKLIHTWMEKTYEYNTLSS